MTTYPRLTHAETLELINRAQSGDIAARNVLIEANMGLAVRAAIRYQQFVRDNAVTFEDLKQDGVFGLIAAIDHFQPERWNAFSTVARFWIRLAVQRPAITAGTIKRATNPTEIKDTYINYIRQSGVIYVDAGCLGFGGLSLAEVVDETTETHNKLTILDAIARALATPEPLIEDVIDARLEAQRILDGIKPEYRPAFLRWAVEDVSFRDACIGTGVSKSNLYKIVKTIREREANAE